MSGSADGATVKVAKAAISGVVPVVGGILSEVSETVMAGAGMLKNTIGIFGMLAVLAACAYPFLQLGVQYLLYKLSAFLAAAVGPPGLSKLIGGLGGAFGLVLGMTGCGGIAAAGVHPGLCGGGDAMIGMIRQWLTAVVTGDDAALRGPDAGAGGNHPEDHVLHRRTAAASGDAPAAAADRPGEPAHP